MAKTKSKGKKGVDKKSDAAGSDAPPKDTLEDVTPDANEPETVEDKADEGMCFVHYLKWKLFLISHGAY